ncbi:alpha/beta hydrolase family protein [Nocardia cyriacigeorgica]|uniref:Platelet-activating factor acetylhydrolase n=1 Tax=Nocardia cyriacigeorgica TaxID=135487 RepID=A0A5R8P0Q2_9NOCA|nr:hypothetical protein [Nocardia cyriacigeorgica]TLF82478.1 hypothetical protein FEK34_01675 [Nocardia cyriacigeorgica]
MSSIDMAVSAIAVLFAVLALVASGWARTIAPFVWPLLFLGACAQLLLEGFYWQFAPVYLLIPLSLLLVLPAHRPEGRRRVLLIAGRVGAAVLAVAAVLATALPPVPALPEPTGPHVVGSTIFRWVDADRPETATPAAEDRRNVVVQAWYPAQWAGGRQYLYLDGYDRLPDRVTLIPAQIMRGYHLIDSHAYADAPISTARERWPVVLFSPGYGAPRAFYTSLVVDLASRGFVVLAVDHPYESAVTELADGTIATNNQDVPAEEPESNRYMSTQLDLRTADLRFVVDQLTRPDAMDPEFAAHLDTEHIAAIGHSFGGAAAAAALAHDPRLRAAANIDGTLYGDLPTRSLPGPFLLIDSDRAETGHSQRYLDGNATLLANLRAPGYRFEIADANHYSFTDVPLFLSHPARFVASRFIGGSRGPAATQHATNDLLTAFLNEPLGGEPADVTAAARQHRGIEGGAVGG